MTFEEYAEQARKTAIYPKTVGKMYVNLGLLGEVGELANQYKKIYRDDGMILTEERRAILLKEIGDITWYCAMFCYEHNLNFNDPPPMVLMPSNFELQIFMLTKELIVALDPKVLEFNIVDRLMSHVQRLAAMFGFTMDQVYEHNLEKLADRAARDRLVGSGDMR